MPLGALERTCRVQAIVCNQMTKTLLAVACFALLGRFAEAQTASTCRASDMDSERFKSYVRDLVTTTDSARVQLRTHLGLKPIDSTRVVPIADDAICNRVAQGINKALATPGMVRALYVVAAGSMYASQDPGHPAGEWWPTVTLDKKYKVIGAVLAP
jgi:hypothetical protein